MRGAEQAGDVCCHDVTFRGDGALGSHRPIPHASPDVLFLSNDMVQTRCGLWEGVSEEEIERRWTSQIPRGRLGRVEEFADAAAFLVSERAGYINGVSVAVDGGLSKGLM